jgi:hypothetical protein
MSRRALARSNTGEAERDVSEALFDGTLLIVAE